MPTIQRNRIVWVPLCSARQMSIDAGLHASFCQMKRRQKHSASNFLKLHQDNNLDNSHERHTRSTSVRAEVQHARRLGNKKRETRVPSIKGYKLPALFWSEKLPKLKTKGSQYWHQNGTIPMWLQSCLPLGSNSRTVTVAPMDQNHYPNIYSWDNWKLI